MKENILASFLKKDRFRRYVFLTLSLFLTAIVYNLFLRPVHFIAGGTNGISLLLEYMFGFDSAVTLFFLYFVLLLISLLFLGKEETIASVYIALLYPLLVKFTRSICSMISIDYNSLLLIALFAGILLGISNGIIYKMGFNTGGIGVVSKVISKKRKLSLPMVNFFINVCIVLVAIFTVGIESVLYSIVLLFVCRFVSNKVLLGVSNHKMYYIISSESDRILEFLQNELHRDATIHQVIGKYTNKKRRMIMTVLPNREYFILKSTIQLLDSHAFIFSCDSYEIRGQDQKIRSIVS